MTLLELFKKKQSVESELKKIESIDSLEFNLKERGNLTAYFKDGCVSVYEHDSNKPYPRQEFSLNTNTGETDLKHSTAREERPNFTTEEIDLLHQQLKAQLNTNIDTLEAYLYEKQHDLNAICKTASIDKYNLQRLFEESRFSFDAIVEKATA